MSMCTGSLDAAVVCSSFRVVIPLAQVVARMESVGSRMFAERPEWYEGTKFAFMMNKTLEKYARETHIHRYKVEDCWAALPGAETIRKFTATKVQADHTPYPESSGQSWDAGQSDEAGGRQFVAGETGTLW